MSENAEKLLIFDASRCTACHYCEMACSYFHFKVIDIGMANLRVLVDPEIGAREVAHCLHCDNAVCLDACPTGAIYRDEARIVRINPMKCIGCRSCVNVCPVGVPWFHAAEGAVKKCDMCDGDPQCAKYCSPGAIRVIDRKDYRAEIAKLDGDGGD